MKGIKNINTYFLILKAVPCEKNVLHGKAKGIYAHFWILDKTKANALKRAKFYLSEHGYSFFDLEQEPVETTEEQYADPEKALGLANYVKAQKWGISAYFLGWKNDQ